MEIRIVGVVGAGTMGSGIAQVCAQFGYTALIHDASPSAVTGGLEKIRHNLERQVEKGRLNATEAETVLGRIREAPALADLAPADLVVEAVYEDLEIKKRLFVALEDICSPSTVLATNTSILSPTAIGAAIELPGRTIGLHFFNPAPVMRLVEVTPGLQTVPETTATVTEFCRALGKTPVVAMESPGGIVSRILIAMRNEAVNMLAEGVASKEDIDTAMKLGAGFPMGPFELIDLIGVDIHVLNSDSLVRELGDSKYRPHPLLRNMYRAGRLGRKTGRGFYEYGKK